MNNNSYIYNSISIFMDTPLSQAINTMITSKSKFLDAGNLGLSEIPEEIYNLGDNIEFLNLHSSYPDTESKIGKWLSCKNPRGQNKENLITSFSHIEKLKNLKFLCIKVVLNEKSLSFLEKIPTLEALTIIPDKDYLDSKEIKEKKVDFSFIGSLKNLKKIWINRIGIENLDFLATLEKLEYLNFQNNPVTNIDGLAPLKNLKEIHAGGSLSDVKSLSNLTKLEKFVASWGKIKDLTPFKKLTSLTFLHLQDEVIEDVEALSELIHLEYLCLCHNQINSISPLKKLKKLKTFCCMSNKIEDISVISNFPQLKKTELGTNKISVIDPLKKLSKLSWLDLRSNQISSLPEWFKTMILKQFKELYLQNNPIKDVPEKIINTPYSCLAKLKKFLQS